MLTIENKYNITAPAFKNILESEKECLEWLNCKLCIGIKRDIAYSTLKRIRERKTAYEQAVIQRQNRR